jgi:hypothetical protein
MPQIGASRRFISSYLQSLENIRKLDPEVVLKGKQIIHIQGIEERANQSVRVPWVMPPAGALKLNIYGAFLAQSGQAGAGMILRRSDGTIVFVACRSLRFCSSALDSEINACIECQAGA